jgi:hypothetical protein
MGRGRPPKSEVRERIKILLSEQKQAYGYQLVKLYADRFPAVSSRLIYYHRKKGVQLGEFEVAKIQQEQGHYSWGPSVEKTYYRLAKKRITENSPGETR